MVDPPWSSRTVAVSGSLGMLVCEDKVVQIISRQMASNHSLLALLIHEVMMRRKYHHDDCPFLIGDISFLACIGVKHPLNWSLMDPG